MVTRCLHQNEIRANCICEKVNTMLRDIISSYDSSHRDPVKDMDVCASIQRDGCPNQQTLDVIRWSLSWVLAGR